jgi:2-dehydropantoate 2-reductase
MASTSGRIHVLGVGNLGRFFAHALAIRPNPPPITLLLHRASLLEEWEKAGRRIEITTDGIPNSKGTFDVEVVEDSQQSEDIIENLIVTTKTINTVKALASVKHRLTTDSTILFAQNGMGTVEEVTSSIFEEASKRPNYLASITSHGVFSTGPFRSVHAGMANVAIGQVGESHSPNRSQYLIDKIVQAPVLAAKEVSPVELTRLRLEKLVINAMINPLTAIFNCRNGELFNGGAIDKVMRLLLAEASQVITSLPELRDDPATESRFSTQNLEVVVLDIADKTAQNTSSMLQDVRAGKETEIDYINGYIVKRGEELGIDCEHNEKLVEMVKEGAVINAADAGKYFPGPGDQRSLIGDAISVFI